MPFYLRDTLSSLVDLREMPPEELYGVGFVLFLEGLMSFKGELTLSLAVPVLETELFIYINIVDIILLPESRVDSLKIYRGLRDHIYNTSDNAPSQRTIFFILFSFVLLCALYRLDLFRFSIN